MKVYQNNAYIKDLNWLHFHDEPRVEERQQGKDQQSYIFVFEVYLTFFQVVARSTSPDTTAVFHAWLYGTYRDTEQPQEKETS